MRGSSLTRRSRPAVRSRHVLVAGIVGMACVVQSVRSVQAAERYDPFEARPQFHDPFEANPTLSAKNKRNQSKRSPLRDPFDEAPRAASKPAPLETVYEPPRPDNRPRPANFQAPAAELPPPTEPLDITPPQSTSPQSEQAMNTQQPTTTADPCAAAAERPLFELGIAIEPPAGQLPTNRAATCWESINSKVGPLAGARYWAGFNYQWDATCLCHRPLYFEEINLERYGYGCGWCLQPAASAAHFFGTVPALPYLMTVDCPQECIYTLGHYRPGSCPPWRHHWPPCDPLAAAAQGGVLTGLIFLIP